MTLDWNRKSGPLPGSLPGDAGEKRQPRSLALALQRMGFPLPPAASAAAGHRARTWHGPGDDPAPDWQPL